MSEGRIFRFWKAVNAQLTTGLNTCTDANASQVTTITDLKKANDAWADAALKQGQTIQLAENALEKANATRTALLRNLAAREATDRLSLACQAVLGMDLATTCPAIADGIKSRAQ